MIGIVILNYNSAGDTIENALTLKSFDNVDCIVAVDNCSPDNSYEKMKPYEDGKLTVVKTSHNGGYSFGNNRGADVCIEKGCDMIIFCNPDAHISQQSIQELYDAMMNNREYGLLTGEQFNDDGSKQVPAFLKFHTPEIVWRDLVKETIFGRAVSKVYRKLTDKELDWFGFNKVDTTGGKIVEIPAAKGACIAFRTSDFVAVNGFDEEFFLYWEEQVMASKMRSINKKIGLVNGSEYYHYRSKSISSEMSFYDIVKISQQSEKLYLTKYWNIGKFRTKVLSYFRNKELEDIRLNPEKYNYK